MVATAVDGVKTRLLRLWKPEGVGALPRMVSVEWQKKKADWHTL